MSPPSLEGLLKQTKRDYFYLMHLSHRGNLSSRRILWEYASKNNLIGLDHEDVNVRWSECPRDTKMRLAKSSWRSQFEYFSDMRLDDCVVVMEGIRHLLGVGLVDGGYDFRQDLEGKFFRHVRPIVWELRLDYDRRIQFHVKRFSKTITRVDESSPYWRLAKRKIRLENYVPPETRLRISMRNVRPHPVVLMQHMDELTSYDDQIGERYNYPSRYFDRIIEGAPFVYCRPREGPTGAEMRRSGTVYFGTGRIGTIRRDVRRSDHRYCEIEDYYRFPREVSYRDASGVYLENGTSQSPVMRSAVRSISDEALQRIITGSGLDQGTNGLFGKLQETNVQAEQVRELNKAYQSATPREKQYLTRRVERGAAIGGFVKLRNQYVCQICQALPFRKLTGGLYAEAHHHIPLERIETGSLASTNVICVCANCHRKIHHGFVKTVAADEESITFEIEGKRVIVKRNKLA